jgi:transcription elongation factor GreB
VSIVGTDKVDLKRNHISWLSPSWARVDEVGSGDSVVLQVPGGSENLTVLEARC